MTTPVVTDRTQADRLPTGHVTLAHVGEVGDAELADRKDPAVPKDKPEREDMCCFRCVDCGRLVDTYWEMTLCACTDDPTCDECCEVNPLHGGTDD